MSTLREHLDDLKRFKDKRDDPHWNGLVVNMVGGHLEDIIAALEAYLSARPEVARSSETPRTDGILPSQSFIDETRLFDRHYYLPLIEHARRLERELDHREKQLIECQHQLITRNTELFEARSVPSPRGKQ